MNFVDEPRRSKIEPMHEFMVMWARWGRYHPVRQESMTLKIMMWIRDHSKRVEEIREGLVTDRPIHVQEDDAEKIAWKVEHYLRMLGEEGKVRERNILKTYYLMPDNSKVGYVARKLDCKPWQVEKVVKDALYVLSQFWRD